MKKFTPVLCFLLMSCTMQPVTIPVAVIGQDGKVLTGTNTVSMDEASFTVTNGKLTCGGSYRPDLRSITISMPVSCSDGRKGIVRATRDSILSGSGTVRLNDGYTADFLFGTAAQNF